MGDPNVLTSLLACTYLQHHVTWLPWQPNINHWNMASLTFQQKYYGSPVTIINVAIQHKRKKLKRIQYFMSLIILTQN